MHFKMIMMDVVTVILFIIGIGQLKLKSRNRGLISTGKAGLSFRQHLLLSGTRTH